MESPTVRSALQVRLPDTQKQYTTTHASENTEKLRLRFMHEWTSFLADVRDTLDHHPELGNIDIESNSSEHENYLIGNEIGTTSRIIQNICIPLNRAWAACGVALQMADYHSVHPRYRASDKTPDLIFRGLSDSSPIGAPIELKTEWTVFLDYSTITSDEPARRSLEPPLGQLSAYMRASQSRYGLLSTYAATVFVRRTEDYRFEVSQPVFHNSTNPTLRECIFVFGLWVQATEPYKESAGFDQALLGQELGAPTGMPQSGYRRGYAQGNSGEGSNVPPTDQASGASGGAPSGFMPSAFAGGIGTTTSKSVFVNIGEIVRIDADQLVKGLPGENRQTWSGHMEKTKITIKFFPIDEYESFKREVEVYDNLSGIFFVSRVLAGNVVCSSLLPSGFVLGLEWFNGKTLEERRDLWGDTSTFNRIRKALEALRTAGYWLEDVHPGNILIRDGSLKLIDLESALPNTNNYPAEQPELGRLVRMCGA